MLVQEWMTEKVITVTGDTSMMRASRIMKENKVRRLPVVDNQNKLIGIVTDRDIKDASPSKATSLEVHEVYYLLSELKVKDIMTKKPISAKPSDSVEHIAIMMTQNSFGGVPVVDDDNKVCGIITDTDIFKVLSSITGVECGGIQLAFEMATSPGSLRVVLDSLKALDAGVISVLTSNKEEGEGKRRVYIRLRKLTPEKEQKVVSEMKQKFDLLYWEPGLKEI